MVTASQTIIRDTIFYVKNYLTTVITDPIAASRPAIGKFILTSYPTRPEQYPVITIKDISQRSGPMFGMQTTAFFVEIDIEVRVWANTVAQRDQLADSIFYNLKQNQFVATTGQIAQDLHDLELLSSINVDNPDGAKCKVQTYKFKFVAI